MPQDPKPVKNASLTKGLIISYSMYTLQPKFNTGSPFKRSRNLNEIRSLIRILPSARTRIIHAENTMSQGHVLQSGG